MDKGGSRLGSDGEIGEWGWENDHASWGNSGKSYTFDNFRQIISRKDLKK